MYKLAQIYIRIRIYLLLSFLAAFAAADSYYGIARLTRISEFETFLLRALLLAILCILLVGLYRITVPKSYIPFKGSRGVIVLLSATGKIIQKSSRYLFRNDPENYYNYFAMIDKYEESKIQKRVECEIVDKQSSQISTVSFCLRATIRYRDNYTIDDIWDKCVEHWRKNPQCITKKSSIPTYSYEWLILKQIDEYKEEFCLTALKNCSNQASRMEAINHWVSTVAYKIKGLSYVESIEFHGLTMEEIRVTTVFK